MLVRYAHSVLLATIVLFGSGRLALADSLVFQTPPGATNDFNNHPVAATAEFSIQGNTLTVLLTNTNTEPIIPFYQRADVLLGLFFDIANNPTLMYTAAEATSLRTGATVTPGPVDVKDEWAYKFDDGGLGGVVDPMVTQEYGLGAAGYGIFPGVAGVDYGIIDNGYVGGTPGPIFDTIPFAQNAVAFSFTFAGTLSLTDISNVRFQYGSALNEGNFAGIPPVPEPGTAGLLGIGGLVLAGFLGRRRLRG